MQGKEDLAAFLSALVSANQELFAAEKLQQCLGSPGFKTACSEGLLDHCHVTDPRGNVSRPLELAARRGYTSVVSELLALGASPALHSHVRFPPPIGVPLVSSCDSVRSQPAPLRFGYIVPR